MQHRGRPSSGLIDLAIETHCDQCTLVPVMPGGKSEARRAGRPTRPAARSIRQSSVSRRPASASACSSDPEEAPVTMGCEPRRRSHRAVYCRPFARAFESGAGCRTSIVRALRRGRRARPRSGPGCERRSRSGSAQPAAVQDAAASRRSLDRARARQPRVVGRPRPLRPRLPRGGFAMIVPS